MAKIFNFEAYKGASGKDALSCEMHINDLVPQQNWQTFPDDLRSRAVVASTILADVFDELGQVWGIERDMLTGQRLDPKKRHAVGVGMRTGNLDIEVIRPYMRRSMTKTMPKIAIVCSAGNAELHASPDYVGKISQVVLAISWACEIVGVEVVATLNAEFIESEIYHRKYREAQVVRTIYETGRTTPLQRFSVLQSRNSLIWDGFKNALFADPEGRDVFASLRGMSHNANWGTTTSSRNGGKACHWARVRHEADLVISLGDITDTKFADIVLGHEFDINRAVKSIAQQVKKLIVSPNGER